jgi:hypothetical protein
MIFRLILMSQLGRAHFEEWPVWSEYYEPDELEDIEDWGIDSGVFLAELRALNLGNEHAAYPALRFDPLPERMRLYIKVQFTTRRGDKLDGYVVNEDAYAGAIFLGEEEFGFNVMLHDFARQMLNDLASHLRTNPTELLPLTFETDIRTSEGNRVAGLIDL